MSFLEQILEQEQKEIRLPYEGKDTVRRAVSVASMVRACAARAGLLPVVKACRGRGRRDASEKVKVCAEHRRYEERNKVGLQVDQKRNGDEAKGKRRRRS